MKFISCIPIRGSQKDGNEDELVLCQCQIQGAPQTKDDVKQMSVAELIVSEGAEIHMRHNFKVTDLKVFESERDCVWYELLKFLTGHKIQFDSLDDKIDFSSWVCYIDEDGEWQLVLELESSGFVKKLAQVQLEAVDSGEADLFQFTNTLFQHWCQSNDRLHKLGHEISSKSDIIETMRDERQKRDCLLMERDKRTRAIVVNLLNEKKAKIKELYERIDTLQSSSISKPLAVIPSDSDIVNMHVNHPVSHLTSPGRQRKTGASEGTMKPVKRRLVLKEEVKSDDFEDFQFFGITKSPLTPSKKNIPQKNVKQESQSTDTDSVSQILSSPSSTMKEISDTGPLQEADPPSEPELTKLKQERTLETSVSDTSETETDAEGQEDIVPGTDTESDTELDSV